MSENCFMAKENYLNLILRPKISKNASIKGEKKLQPNIGSRLDLGI